jgi:hypothetical protein
MQSQDFVLYRRLLMSGEVYGQAKARRDDAYPHHSSPAIDL